MNFIFYISSNNEVNWNIIVQVSNRVCVALSRSKLGLYVIGNMHFLTSYSLLWNRLSIALTDAGCIGDGFPAFCIKHDVTQVIGINECQFRKSISK